MGEVYNMDGSKQKNENRGAGIIGKLLGVWTIVFLFWIVFYSTKYVATHLLNFLGISF
tara:strand:- start:188 stop:361 length:174 start_codon:yes stop_codon:yes gene_type:complete